MTCLGFSATLVKITEQERKGIFYFLQFGWYRGWIWWIWWFWWFWWFWWWAWRYRGRWPIRKGKVCWISFEANLLFFRAVFIRSSKEELDKLKKMWIDLHGKEMFGVRLSAMLRLILIQEVTTKDACIIRLALVPANIMDDIQCQIYQIDPKKNVVIELLFDPFIYTTAENVCGLNFLDSIFSLLKFASSKLLKPTSPQPLSPLRTLDSSGSSRRDWKPI